MIDTTHPDCLAARFTHLEAAVRDLVIDCREEIANQDEYGAYLERRLATLLKLAGELTSVAGLVDDAMDQDLEDIPF